MSTNERLHYLDTNQSLNTYYYDKTFTISICYAAGYDLVGSYVCVEDGNNYYC